MATYAALVSLMNVLNRIQHPTCPVSLDQSLIQSLFDKVSFLVDFIEACSQRISKDFQRKMIDAAFAAEDMMESYIVDRILTSDGDEEYAVFSQNLEKAIQDMDLIVQRAMQVKEKNGEEDQQHTCLARVDSLLVPPSGKNTMVGLNKELIHLMDRLTTDQSRRQVIPVVGMGGIGKTTLVRNVYNDAYIIDYFQIRAWVTVSQNYTVRSIIRTLLRDTGFPGIGKISDEQLGEKLHKCLWGRKYLIVLDDVWSSVAWDEVGRFFPDNKNGSRVMLTTRLSSVALNVGSGSSYEMKLLDKEKSWCLLSQTVFGEEVCPHELEKLGKKIARSCKGLPLAIVVIGGMLKMSQMTREYWEGVANNVISIISTESDGHCLEILSLSYNHLPVHLKPCFLYMATFIEDDSISTSELINLWVVDGFLKPVKDRTSEEVALEYLNDLIQRNLIMATPLSSNSRIIEYCSVHDSLREFCLREAQNERFLYPILQDEHNLPQELESARRLVYHLSGNESNSLLPPMPLTRSFYCNKWGAPKFATHPRLLRTLHVFSGSELQIDTTQLVNIRYLACQVDEDGGAKLLSSIPLFWNLQVLIVSGNYENLILPSEIWEFTSLKCLIFSEVTLPDPASAQTFSVLDDLRVLKGVKDFNYTNEVVNRIPNLRELSLYYAMDYLLDHPEVLSRSFVNLARHDTVQALRCEFLPNEKDSFCVFELENLKLSPTLRELELSESHIPWENMTIIGSLPNLEVLTLVCDAFCGEEWNPVEGEFERLKCLSISRCDLKTWTADNSHFPRLTRLFLEFLDLEEIPLDIGEVSSLELISLYTEKKSLVLSAKEILDAREDQGLHDLVIEGLYFMDTGYDEEKKLEEKSELEEIQMSNNNFRVQLFGLEPEDEAEADSGNDNSNFQKLLVNMWKLDEANRKNVQKQLVKLLRSEEVDRIAEAVSEGIAGAIVDAFADSVSKGVADAVAEVRTKIADAVAEVRTKIAGASERMANALSKEVSDGIGEMFTEAGRMIVKALLIGAFIIVVIILLFLLLLYVLYRSYFS